MNDHSNPLVSVIMNSFNGEKYLSEAIESIYSQSYANWEIIFWDNASTDNTKAIAQSFGSKIKYFCSDQNMPLGYARNLAFKKANGEFIAFLDDDDLWMQSKLEQQIPLFNNKEIGLVYSDVIYFNQKGFEQKHSKNFELVSGKCFARLLSEIEVFPITTASVVFRAEVLKSNLINCSEDLVPIRDSDLFCRIAYDWSIGCVKKPLSKIRAHDEQLSISNRNWFHEEWERNLSVYEKLIFDFKTKFSKERSALIEYIAFIKAKYYWSINNSKFARDCIRPYMMKRPKLFIFFIISFFPEKIIRKFFHYIRGDVRV